MPTPRRRGEKTAKSTPKPTTKKTSKKISKKVSKKISKKASKTAESAEPKKKGGRPAMPENERAAYLTPAVSIRFERSLLEGDMIRVRQHVAALGLFNERSDRGRMLHSDKIAKEATAVRWLADLGLATLRKSKPDVFKSRIAHDRAGNPVNGGAKKKATKKKTGKKPTNKK